MELAVKAQPLWRSNRRMAVSGCTGVEATVLADGVLVLACGELVGTAVAGDTVTEPVPVALQAPTSSASVGMSHKGSQATCIDCLGIFFLLIRYRLLAYRDLLRNEGGRRGCEWTHGMS